MTEPTQDTAQDQTPNIHSRMGAVEARMQTVEQRLDKHDTQITNLEKGDSAMLTKLAENDTRWEKIQQQLQIVDQIQDIQQTMAYIGKLVKAAAAGIKWCVVTTSLICGIYLAIKSSDLTSLQSLIQTLMGM